MCKKLLIVVLFWGHVGYSQIESNIKIAFSGRFTIGTFWPKLQNYNSALWTTSGGLHLSLEPYIKFRWKNSFDLSLGLGGYLNNYNFAQKNFSYSVAYYSLKYETRFSKYIQLKSGPMDFLSIGCGFGVSPTSLDQLTRSKSGYVSTTYSYPVNPFYFSPHIGTYRREGRLGYSLSVQYTHYQTKNPYIQFDLKGNGASALGSHKGDYIGLNIIVDYDLKRNQKLIDDKFPYTKPVDADDRELITEQTLDVRRRRMKIYVWDHGMVDHDTITLLLNDHPILSDYGLDYTKEKIRVRLPKNENYLTLYAHNEGTVKPNTAAVIIQTGWFRKRQFILNSTMHTSEALKIVYK